MATFGWSYSNNFTGSKRPRQETRNVEEWQKNRAVNVQPLHPQSHSAETVSCGKRFRYDHRARLYVGNLSIDTNEVTLAEHFSTFGELIGVKIIKDCESGTSRGFGFVTFDSIENEEAKKWFAYNHLKINGREITVRNAERRVTHKDKEGIGKSAEQQDTRRGPTLYWEYKWCDNSNAEVYGPYETNLMLQWSKSGYFESGCWVRQVDPRALHEDESSELDVTVNKKTKLMLDYSDSSSESGDDTDSIQLAKDGCGRDDDKGSGGDDSSDGTQSTEFVHVSEIDFSLFP